MNDFQLFLAGVKLGAIITGIAAYAIMAYRKPKPKFSDEERWHFEKVLQGFDEQMNLPKSP